MFKQYLKNLIKEEWDILTMVGKIFIFIPWLIRSILIILSSPLLYMHYKFINSEIYYELEGIFIETYLDYIIYEGKSD